MSQSLRSFLFGNLAGVISFLGVLLFLQSGVPWTFALTAIGILVAWNCVPLPRRQLAFVIKVEDASNGVTLLGWTVSVFACAFFLLKIVT